MKKLTANDNETKSANLVQENIEKLKVLFPELISEGSNGISVNIDVLKALVGDKTAMDSDEKYGLNWHGKRRSRQLALTPSTGTLRPCPKESVDWDTTQNLMIEGDNLEVLKLLQKSYAGRVKLIYIDPPYNTGKDFVYPDDFRDSIKNYLELTGQVEGGRKISSNTEASGRFHADWLNMMYPRLKLAKNLLAPNGLILISIDEVEVRNLRSMCDEIFGEELFVEEIVWKNKYGSGALTRGFASVHEYILVYSRSPVTSIAAPLNDEQRSQYKLRDSKYKVRGGYITQPLATTSKDERLNLVYPIVYKGKEILPEKQWIWSKERFNQAYKNDEVVINEKEGKFSVRVKQYLRDEHGVERLGKPLSLMNGPFNQDGTKELAELLGRDVYNFPKPSALVQYFVSFVLNEDTNRDGIYIDFFAGSGTTGHAVMAQNAYDNGRRRFLLVQLPEPLAQEKREQKNAAEFCVKIGKPQNIAEITKERLRRSAEKVLKENPMFAGDLGFRIFKLDSSNIRAWEPNRNNLNKTLLESVEHLRTERTETDILYELLIKLGLDLCVPIETRVIAEKDVHVVGGGVLIACLATAISREAAEPLALGIIEWHKALAPAGDTTCVFRDSAFADDVAKTNLAAILNQNGITTVRSL